MLLLYQLTTILHSNFPYEYVWHLFLYFMIKNSHCIHRYLSSPAHAYFKENMHSAPVKPCFQFWHLICNVLPDNPRKKASYFRSYSILLLFNSFNYPSVVQSFLLLITLSFKKYWKNLLLFYSLPGQHIFVSSAVFLQSMHFTLSVLLHYLLFSVYEIFSQS